MKHLLSSVCYISQVILCGIWLFASFSGAHEQTKCDPLNENPTCMHFPWILFYDIFWKNQWTVKVSAISGKWFWCYSNTHQEEQNNQFVVFIWKNVQVLV